MVAFVWLSPLCAFKCAGYRFYRLPSAPVLASRPFNFLIGLVVIENITDIFSLYGPFEGGVVVDWMKDIV